MATTPRWGLRYPADSDAADVPLWMSRLAADLDDVAKDDQGLLADRPVSTPGSPGKKGRYWKATDKGQLFRDHGTGYDELHANPLTGCFSAYRNAAWSPGFPAGPTALVFDTEEWDTSLWYDTTNGRFTPQTAGIYRLGGYLQMPQFAGNQWYRLWLRKNGATHRRLGGENDSSGSISEGPGAGSSALVQANGSTDYFDLALEISNGTFFPLTGAGNAYFQGELVGRT